jgi:DNA mismatch repair ATPase MutS
MDSVFRLIDRTLSSPGQAVLYSLIRTPLLGEEAFEERERAMAGLARSRGAARIRRVLSRLGAQPEGELYGFLRSMAGEVPSRRRFLFLLLGIAAFLSLAAPFLAGLPGLALIAGIGIVNAVIHYRHRPVVTVESPSYHFLHKLLSAAMRLSRLRVPELACRARELAALSAALRGVRVRSAALSPRRGVPGDFLEMLLEYPKVFFLLETTAYYFLHNLIVRRNAEICRCYRAVGEIDALLSASRLREDFPGTCTPRLMGGPPRLACVDAVHPLVERPVANSIILDSRGAVITGSNMSGKSTFLRTLGVNQVLASTLCTAFAREWSSSLFVTISCIASRDNILAAESHYLAEARRLLGILREVQGRHPVLAVVDEILSGTSSEERIQASIRILAFLHAKNGLVCAATHDREIARGLSGLYELHHFSHTSGEQGLAFDYALRPGIVGSGDAIDILEHLGFPSEIIRGARGGLP